MEKNEYTFDNELLRQAEDIVNRAGVSLPQAFALFAEEIVQKGCYPLVESENSDKCCSEQFTGFITFLRDCEADFRRCREGQRIMDLKRNDLLHELELNSACASTRSRVAEELRDCLQERRQYKDRLEVLTPIVLFYQHPCKSKAADALGHALGCVRKAERNHITRMYHNRILPTPIPQNETREA